MKNTNKLFGFIALVAIIGFSFAVLSLTGCGGGGNSNQETAPTIITASLPDGTTGMAYNQTLAATGDALTWSLENGTLPTGLNLLASGTISGTPTTAGQFTFTVKAANATGSKTKQFSITITTSTVGAQGTAPTITTASLPNGVVGTAYSQTLAATGDTPITWSLENGTLPTGFNLLGSGTISGTPTTAGQFTFTVKAANATGSKTKQLSITITTVGAQGTAPTITTTTLPNGTTGTAYNQTLAATGDTPITWSLENGTLPTGLNLLGSGTISGTPTTAGQFTFTVKANNAAGNNTKQLSITITTVLVGPQFWEPSKARDCDDVRYCESRLHTLYLAGKNDFLGIASMVTPSIPTYTQASRIDNLTRAVNNAALDAWKADPDAKFHATQTNGGFNVEAKYDYRVEVGDGMKRVPCMSSAHLRAGAANAVNYFENYPDPSIWALIRDRQLSYIQEYMVRDK